MVNAEYIKPTDIASRVLFDEREIWQEAEELTIMKVMLNGKKDGEAETVVYNMLDRYDPVTKISSMSRSTGYTATATVNMMAAGLFHEKGVFPPELVGKHKACFDYVMAYLESRGVMWKLES